MKFAMIGLGKMGLNLVKNAADNGHDSDRISEPLDC
ncbi:hypothetical protein H7R52_02580 [Weissella confusa]|uniref:6-phosphogluconate dehydrogenase NADP-binding domain-containing protein n=1 Tax=Weissella confusa TaxID=1583 RepID=A0A923SNV9_WEICO|nr:hypothetical protein [Weissella confusa]